ncbi:hypothetical protein J3E68DRAFT_7662 [Trichoderma sp. SZMC 28012]
MGFLLLLLCANTDALGAASGSYRIAQAAGPGPGPLHQSGNHCRKRVPVALPQGHRMNRVEPGTENREQSLASYGALGDADSGISTSGWWLLIQSTVSVQVSRKSRQPRRMRRSKRRKLPSLFISTYLRPAASSRTILFSFSASNLQYFFIPPSFQAAEGRKRVTFSFAIFIAHAHARHRSLGPCMLPPLLITITPLPANNNTNDHHGLLLTRPSHEPFGVMETPGMSSFSTSPHVEEKVLGIYQ